MASQPEQGVPAWVVRGSGAATQEGERVLLGVGVASDIANPALLRATAEDRARVELGKVAQTFVGVLMDDVQITAPERDDQTVRQAQVTFSAAALAGSRVVDRYTDATGTCYALAQISLDALMRAARSAEASSLPDVVSPEALARAFENQAVPPLAPTDIERDASSVPAMRRGGEPLWVLGSDPEYPAHRWLCGVGVGSRREDADAAALAALARVFHARVQAVARDFMGAYGHADIAGLEVQMSESRVDVSTEHVLRGARLQAAYQGRDAVYALACLDRAVTARRLREQVLELDERVRGGLERARSADEMTKLRVLSEVVQTLMERERRNGELRIVAVDGVGVAGPHSLADVAWALQDAEAALAVAVVASGAHGDEVRHALMDALTQRGFRVRPSQVGDVVVAATLRLESEGPGKGNAAHLHFVRGVLQLELRDAVGTTVAALSATRREGHRTQEEAERLVVRRLVAELAGPLGDGINASMRGTRP